MEQITEQLKSTVALPVARLPSASTIDEFAANNRISRSQAYKEAAAGRLTVRKVAGRSIVLPEDEQAWREALPKMPPRKSA